MINDKYERVAFNAECERDALAAELDVELAAAVDSVPVRSMSWDEINARITESIARSAALGAVGGAPKHDSQRRWPHCPPRPWRFDSTPEADYDVEVRNLAIKKGLIK